MAKETRGRLFGKRVELHEQLFARRGDQLHRLSQRPLAHEDGFFIVLDGDLEFLPIVEFEGFNLKDDPGLWVGWANVYRVVICLFLIGEIAVGATVVAENAFVSLHEFLHSVFLWDNHAREVGDNGLAQLVFGVFVLVNIHGGRELVGDPGGGEVKPSDLLRVVGGSSGDSDVGEQLGLLLAISGYDLDGCTALKGFEGIVPNLHRDALVASQLGTVSRWYNCSHTYLYLAHIALDEVDIADQHFVGDFAIAAFHHQLEVEVDRLTCVGR